MKLITLFLSLIFFTSQGWLNDFEKAKTEAKSSHKQILVNFSGSDWCGPCIKLTKEVFESETFKTYAQEKLVLVRADFPRMKKNKLSKEQTAINEALADKYNKDGTFPLTLLLDENGNVLKKWVGNPGYKADAFVTSLKEK
jgi:thioredoxin-related protein